jgi:hypothetical protein
MPQGSQKYFRYPHNQSRRQRAKAFINRFRFMRKFACHFQWIHIGVGILGNMAFLIGSFCFLQESLKTVGVWLFILGSFGMLIGSIGSAIVKFEQSP